MKALATWAVAVAVAVVCAWAAAPALLVSWHSRFMAAPHTVHEQLQGTALFLGAILLVAAAPLLVLLVAGLADATKAGLENSR